MIKSIASILFIFITFNVSASPKVNEQVTQPDSLTVAAPVLQKIYDEARLPTIEEVSGMTSLRCWTTDAQPVLIPAVFFAYAAAAPSGEVVDPLTLIQADLAVDSLPAGQGAVDRLDYFNAEEQASILAYLMQSHQRNSSRADANTLQIQLDSAMQLQIRKSNSHLLVKVQSGEDVLALCHSAVKFAIEVKAPQP